MAFSRFSDSVLYGRDTGLYDTAAFRAPAVDRGGQGGRKRRRGRRPYGKREIRQLGSTCSPEKPSRTRPGGSYGHVQVQPGNLTTVFRMTIPAQILTTTSNYITLTGTPDMKLRGTSDMTTEPGRIHNYRIDYKIRITVPDYPQGGSTTGAGLYDLGGTLHGRRECERRL